MSALSQMVNRVVGGGRGTAPRMSRGGAGRPTAGYGRAGGTRSQDEAIGRGVRGLLRRFR
ncbi:MAG: hypothetical protein ACTHKG_13415 [Nocardioides sp.]